MAHPRTEIREALVQILKDKGTAAGDFVFDSRRITTPKSSQMPRLYVFTSGETVTGESSLAHPRELDRTVQLVVEGWVSPAGFDSVARPLDDLALEVEEAINTNPGLGGTANDTILTDTRIELDPFGDQTCGFITLEFAVNYQTEVTSSAVDDFLRAPTDYRVNGVGSEDDATDEIQLPGPI